jgi:DNA-directed RNA polymerase specialized sigma24 family protein
MVVLDILPLLRRAARSVVRDDQVVEDACQEALLVLCRRLPILDFAHGRSADAADGALTAWLVRTTVFSARGLCRTATRRQRRERASESATLTWEDEQECNERASLAWQH